jgi:DNA-directed RNA polymerase subunit N (RpoN/RPB10)
MIIPVRCFTCGKVVASLWLPYKHKIEVEGKSAQVALDEVGAKRVCCRRMLLTHVNLIDDLLKYAPLQPFPEKDDQEEENDMDFIDDEDEM